MISRRLGVVLMAFGVLVAGCDFFAPSHRVPSTWKKIDVGGLSLYVPPATTDRPEPGVDWLSGTLEGQDFELNYYVGNYMEFPDAPPAGGKLVRQHIDNRKAKILTLPANTPNFRKPGRPHFVGLVITDEKQNWCLTISGFASQPADLNTIELIYKAIDIPDGGPRAQ